MKDKLFRENKKQFLCISFLILLLVASWIFYVLFGHSLIKAMHEGRSLEILNQIMEARSVRLLEFYFILADRLFIRFSLTILLIIIYLLLPKIYKSIILKPAIFFLITYGCIYLSTCNYNLIMSETITPDADNYISTAEHLLQGKGFYSSADYNSQEYMDFLRTGKKGTKLKRPFPNTYWPPLYPLLLAISMQIFDVNYLSAAVIINRLFLALSITLIYSIIAQMVSKNLKPFAAAFSIGLTLFKPFFYIFSFILAEMTYIGLSLSALFLLHKFYSCGEKKESKILFLSAIFASLALMCRYVGFTVIITGFILIILKNRLIINKKKLINCLVFCSVSLIPALPWFFRNKMLTGFFIGCDRSPGAVSAFKEFDLAVEMIKVLSKDFLFTDNNFIIGSFFAVLLTFAIYKRKTLIALLKTLLNKYITFVVYLFIYFATIILTARTIHLGPDPLDTRLIVSTYPFIIMVIVFLFYQLFNNK